jgi:hypothetical protein
MTDLEEEFLGSLKALLTRYKAGIYPAMRNGGKATFMIVDAEYSGTSEYAIYLTMEDIISYLKKS